MQHTAPTNVTAQFLEQRIREGELLPAMQHELSSRLRVCAATGQIDDHVNNFFMNIIARDALKDKLAQGVKITNRELINYAIRSSYNDIRGDGTNPVTRELYRASTETERKKGIPRGVLRDRRLVFTYPSDGADTQSFSSQAKWVDLRDDSTSATAQVCEDHLAFNELWARVERRAQGCGNWALYKRRFQQRIEGYTNQEISALEGLPVQKVASQCSQAREQIGTLLAQEQGQPLRPLPPPVTVTRAPLSAPSGMKNADPVSGPATWIFQANPKFYKILDAIQQLEQLTFNVTLHKNAIKVGDTVLLWVAGKGAGVYAQARVIEGVALRDEAEQERPFHVGPDQASPAKLTVLLKIERRASKPLLKAELLTDPVLCDLMILRRPNGTNFRVTPEQWQALASRLAQN